MSSSDFAAPSHASDAQIAAAIARAAGELLLEVQAASVGVDPKERGRQGDAQSEVFIRAQLERYFPGDAILSEEELRKDNRRASADRVWIVDPLDGTREYGLGGRTDWAVHIALWSRALQASDGSSGDLLSGAVALPAQGIVLNSEGISEPGPPAHARPRVVVSASRAPQWVEAVAQAIGGEVIPMGSAGAKAGEVVLGRADAYLHAGGQYEWDSAAPAIVARSAGLHVSKIDGSALTYNHDDPYSPDLAICRKELWPAIFEVIQREVTH
ncbi:MAG: 3'(2'),5'-bisphosphate nucleotidase CysQ [Acidimicrobiales bacterium]